MRKEMEKVKGDYWDKQSLEKVYFVVFPFTIRDMFGFIYLQLNSFDYHRIIRKSITHSNSSKSEMMDNVIIELYKSLKGCLISFNPPSTDVPK